jgi:hypothetical protein
MRIEATGHVQADNGGRITYGKKALVAFRAGKPIIKMN